MYKSAHIKDCFIFEAETEISLLREDGRCGGQNNGTPKMSMS